MGAAELMTAPILPPPEDEHGRLCTACIAGHGRCICVAYCGAIGTCSGTRLGPETDPEMDHGL